MKKYVEVSELMELFRDDEMLSCDRPYDVYQWAMNIVAECPTAENIVCLQLSPGQTVWLPDGTEGKVDGVWVGSKGGLRYYIKLPDGKSINFTPKGIGRDVLTENPL